MSIGDLTNLTEYMSRGSHLASDSALRVESGENYEGETYIYCTADEEEFEVSTHGSGSALGVVELIHFLYEHREC